ncbi:FAD-dependent oxidoreductase [Lipingzhangella sp. LS1_29]|uniref:FAD-dependent oxidoreductase n=1 Tax=Lipingzhangella rawalii TaxID=2055835 RepID=A0ABU2H8B8_9ACTN|nr:FAD-dependent oxidoreductase [Lipingzhangella rawalii]MDS1271544.1 FAD-dependent oxidoreductase [Lipingzhangella rawalii]
MDRRRRRGTTALAKHLATGDPATVAVVGSGMAGIETAAELAESYLAHRILLLDADTVGDWLAPRAQRHLRRVLHRLGVEVHDGVRVAEVCSGALITAEGTEHPVDATVWAAGFRTPNIARSAGLEVTDQGRIRVDGTLRSVSDPEVYAVGDAALATPPGVGELRMSCAAGIPMDCAPNLTATVRQTLQTPVTEPMAAHAPERKNTPFGDFVRLSRCPRGACISLRATVWPATEVEFFRFPYLQCSYSEPWSKEL